MNTCSECGELERGQHDADCPRIISVCTHVETEQVQLDTFAEHDESVAYERFVKLVEDGRIIVPRAGKTDRALYIDSLWNSLQRGGSA